MVRADRLALFPEYLMQKKILLMFCAGCREETCPYDCAGKYPCRCAGMYPCKFTGCYLMVHSDRLALFPEYLMQKKILLMFCVGYGEETCPYIIPGNIPVGAPGCIPVNSRDAILWSVRTGWHYFPNTRCKKRFY